MASRIAIADALRLCLAVNVGRKPDDIDATARAWLDLLSDVDDDHLADAVRAHLKASSWWPTPAELRRLLPRSAAGLADQPLALFEAVRRTAGSCGRDGEAVFCRELPRRVSDLNMPAIRAGIAALGGWSALMLVPDPARGGNVRAYEDARRLWVDGYRLACGHVEDHHARGQA